MKEKNFLCIIFLDKYNEFINEIYKLNKLSSVHLRPFTVEAFNFQSIWCVHVLLFVSVWVFLSLTTEVEDSGPAQGLADVAGERKSHKSPKVGPGSRQGHQARSLRRRSPTSPHCHHGRERHTLRIHEQSVRPSERQSGDTINRIKLLMISFILWIKDTYLNPSGNMLEWKHSFPKT